MFLLDFCCFKIEFFMFGLNVTIFLKSVFSSVRDDSRRLRLCTIFYAIVRLWRDWMAIIIVNACKLCFIRWTIIQKCLVNFYKVNDYVNDWRSCTIAIVSNCPPWKTHLFLDSHRFKQLLLCQKVLMRKHCCGSWLYAKALILWRKSVVELSF